MSQEQQLLCERNAHPRDKRIYLDENTHRYYVDGSPEGWTSTTTFIHSLFPVFNADSVISKMMRIKSKWEASKYFGMSRQAIKDMWNAAGDQASSLGTSMHKNLEDYYNGLPHSTEGKEWEMFQQFVSDYPELRAYRTEMSVFDEETGICGQLDMIYHDPDEPGAYLIYDWKRSKEIKLSNKWQKGTHPLTEHLDDCNYVTYSMQLYLYKQILQKHYNLKINGCFLIVLHPQQERYMRIECQDMSKLISDLFELRIAERLKAQAVETEHAQTLKKAKLETNL